MTPEEKEGWLGVLSQEIFGSKAMPKFIETFAEEVGFGEGYEKRTLELAKERAGQIAERFQSEVKLLLQHPEVDPHRHNRGMLFGIALEKVADKLILNRNDPFYRKLRGGGSD